VQESWYDRLDVASTLAHEALSCARTTGDQWVIAMAAWAEALAAGSPEELRERVEQAATLLKEAGNAYHFADVYHVAADRALAHGSDRDALEFCRRAMPLLHEIGHPFPSMLLRGTMGMAALLSGDVEAAGRAFREQLEQCRELVVLPAASRALAGLAAVAAARDDLDSAARLSGAAVAHRYDKPYDAADTRLEATFLQPARKRHGAMAWDAAVREGAALSFEDAIAYALDEPRPQAANPSSVVPPTAAAQEH
jgi:hypothetical protein